MVTKNLIKNIGKDSESFFSVEGVPEDVDDTQESMMEETVD